MMETGSGGGPAAEESRLIVAVRAVLSRRSFGAVLSGVDSRGVLHRLVVRGEPTGIGVGDALEAAGVWRVHSEHGRQFHCEACALRRRLPDRSLLTEWLRRFPGMGPERAARLVAKTRGDLEAVFGDGHSTADLGALIDPERPFFAARIAAAIQTRWRSERGEYRAVRWLEEQGVVDPSVGLRIASFYGGDAPAVLTRNPYVLASVLAWAAVDRIGRRVLGDQLGAEAALRCPERVVGAIDVAVQSFVEQGHTAFPKDALITPVRRRLGLSERQLPSERIVEAGSRIRAVLDGGDRWRAPGCAFMEEELHARFRRMAAGNEPCAVRIPGDSDLRRRLAFLEVNGGSAERLHPEQRDAVLRLVRNPLACLVGGAGTGKTTATRAVVALWESLGGRVELAALSGKAAQRLSEGAGRVGPDRRPAFTVAKLLLGLDLRGEGRNHWVEEADPGQPLPPCLELPDLTPKTLLVLDEASMLGLSDLHRVTERMPPGCRLLLIGDPMQLPPIGFGLVFHHLSGQAAISVRLERVHRQSDESGIPEVARAIREGRLPTLAPYAGVGSGVSFLEADDARLVDAVAMAAEDLGGFRSEPTGLRIIAAVNDDRAGAVNVLNARFHDDNRRSRLKPGEGSLAVAVLGWFKQSFAVGDPVIHTVNDYASGLRNGSLGHVLAIDPDRQGVVIDFDGRSFEFRRGGLLAIRLAYAITCHKAQGSSARRVIVPVQDAANVDVSWIYTAVTRAEVQAVLVGRRAVFDAVLRRPPAWRRRMTGCDFRIEASHRLGAPALACVEGRNHV